jgi:hypothetical protein
VKDLDLLEGHAQQIADELRVGGFVALAVGVATGDHLHRAGTVHADFSGFPDAARGA